MMKVKLSKHPISRRRQRASDGRVFRETAPTSKRNNYFPKRDTRRQILFTDIVSIHATTCLFSVGGVGTLLVFVLLCFIGVTGQGHIDDMQEKSLSMFPSQGMFFSENQRLPHQSVEELSPMGEEDEDDTLQQRISNMGLYGAKYSNTSFPYNYSSYPPFNYDSTQYKLEPTVDTLLPSPRDRYLLSLNESAYDQNVDTLSPKYPTSHKRKNIISANFSPNMRDIQEGEDNLEAIFSGMDQNRTGSIRIAPGRDRLLRTSQKHRSLDAPPTVHHPEQRNKPDDDSSEEKVNDEVSGSHKTKHFSFPIAARHHNFDNPSDPLDYDDYDTLERFIPGNVSHTSGKFRFRQSSQAEVDREDGESGENNSVRSRKRPRRSVVHLYDMVVCSTGCNPLIFKGYGCYCGFLGSGLTVDGIDKCCAKHDWCYHHAKCPPLLTYFVPYYWRCDHGRPQCVSDFRGWKGICGAHLCECDRQFAECLKKFPCPRSRAMCVTSPWSHTSADARTHPSTVSRRVKFWKQPVPQQPSPPPPPLLPPPPFTGLPPFLPFPSIGIPFP